MNFRAIDPTDSRAGLSGGGETDRAVWAKYFDVQFGRLDVGRLDADFDAAWIAAPTASRPSDQLGAPYQREDEDISIAAPQPNERDPSLMERGTRGHRKTQNSLAEYLIGHRIAPMSPIGEPSFDVAWTHEGKLFVAEVKSVTDQNEESQLRLGLGQVLRYRHQMCAGETPVIAVLVPERRPTDPRWMELCDSLGVRLVWPPFDGLLGS